MLKYGASDVLKAGPQVVYKKSKLGEVLSNVLQRKSSLGYGSKYIVLLWGTKSQHWVEYWHTDKDGVLIRLEY